VGWWNLFVGFFASIFAVITGLYAKNSANFGSGIEPLLSYHQYLGITTAAIFTGLFIWRSVMNRKIRAKWRNLYLTVSVLGVLVVFTTGLIGGQMVYEHGANVEIPQTVSEHQNPAQYAPADSVGPEQ